MKLYTEEQVRQAFIDGMKFIAVHPLKYEQDANEYMSSLTPIELPSDDEMGKILEPHSDEYAAGYYGAINMIEEKILNQNK